MGSDQAIAKEERNVSETRSRIYDTEKRERQLPVVGTH